MKRLAARIAAFASFAAVVLPAVQAQPAAPAGAPAPAAAPTSSDTGAQTAAAQDAATRWLALMDAGKSGDAWDAAAPVLQGAVTRATWLDVGRKVRAPLGAVKARKQTSAVYTRTLPGAPEGEYVVIQYATGFAGRGGVTETVVPMRQPDGSWKVTTYLIR